MKRPPGVPGDRCFQCRICGVQLDARFCLKSRNKNNFFVVIFVYKIREAPSIADASLNHFIVAFELLYANIMNYDRHCFGIGHVAGSICDSYIDGISTSIEVITTSPCL